MRDMYRKMHLANIVGKYVNGNMKRRDFLKNAGMLGLGAGCLGTMGTMSRKFIPQAHAGSHGIEWERGYDGLVKRCIISFQRPNSIFGN